MGTSTRIKGPRGGRWTTARSNLTRSTGKSAARVIGEEAHDREPLRGAGADAAPVVEATQSEDRTAKHTTAFIDALRADLVANRDAYDLLATARVGGHRLVTVLAAIESRGTEAPEAVNDAYGEFAFCTWFVRAVCENVEPSDGPSALPPFVSTFAEHAMRRAALRTSERLLELLRSCDLDTGPAPSNTAHRLDVEDLCELYELFFSELVTTVLASYITANLEIAVPFVAGADPTGAIAECIAEEIAKRIPTPCSNSTAHPKGASFEEMGHAMVETTLEVALDLQRGAV